MQLEASRSAPVHGAPVLASFSTVKTIRSVDGMMEYLAVCSVQFLSSFRSVAQIAMTFPVNDI